MIPRDLTVGQTWAFVASRLRGAKRILEVGCGDGALARHLASGGVEVTALDLELTDRTAQRGVKFVEGDFLSFKGKDFGNFDAVLFTSSLHHIHPLEVALDRVLAVLKPGGTLLAEEFAVEAPDESTARWYYGMQALLSGQGVMREPHGHAAHAPAHSHAHHDPEAPPLERWISEHQHEPPLHTGKAMLDAITSRFIDVRHATGPYLYRAIAASLPDTPGGGKIAMRLFERENEAMKDGRVKPVGRRFHAIRPD